MIPIVLALLLSAGILGAAVGLVFCRNPVTMIILVSLVGLLASVFYLLLSAPDVAITEAAIGAGLTSGIYFYGLRQIQRNGRKDP